MKTIDRTIVSTHIIPLLAIIALFLFATRPAAAANDTWSGAGDGTSWNSAANWDTNSGGNAPPVNGDSLEFGTTGQGTLKNNLAFQLAAYGINFDSSSTYTLNGNSVLLSTLASGAGITNSGGTQTFGTLPLVLDWGYYPFTSTGGGSLVLNGGLTLNTGGVAYFDSAVASSTLANDASGLISGLGGAGLTFTAGSSPFTGLATTLSGSVVAYSSWPSTLSGGGPIGATTAGAAVNISVTDTAATSYTLANGAGITYANTIFLNNASTAQMFIGSTAGAQTLDMGAVSGIGGFYVPAGITAQVLKVGSGASTILTAGPESGPATPGAIVFAINGTSSGNQAQLNSSVQDNLSGGKVSVIKTGPGSMYTGSINTQANNTYSGGTYVVQGQLQGNVIGCFGTGPIYAGGNGTVYFNAGTAQNYTNEIYLSPGVGAGSAAAYANGGGFIWGSSSNLDLTFSGPLHLLGNPVTTGPGCRFSTLATSKNLILAGQITGTGTFESYQGGHSGNIMISNTLANNTWTGGILIAPRSTLSSYCKLGAANQTPNACDVKLVSGGGDARFDLNGFSTTINALNSSGTGTLAKQELENNGTTSSTITLGANNGTGYFSGVITDLNTPAKSLSIVKIGTGTQTFYGNAAFTYYGNTTVNAGTLALANNGFIPNSPVITVAAPATFDTSQLSGGMTLNSTNTLNCIGTFVGNLTVNGTIETYVSSTIGTLTNTGIVNTVTLNSGGTYVWNINNAMGTAGAASGWSLLDVSNGTLTVDAVDATPFTINVSSGGAPAANFITTNSYSWVIAQAAAINDGGYDLGQFKVVTTSFQNAPSSASQWSVSISGTNLMLNYTPFIVLTTPLPTNAVTAVQSNNVVFTVTANSLGTSPAFAWTQNGSPLVDGGSSAGGGTIHIVTSNGGYTSTLTIAGVDSIHTEEDSTLIAVTATEMYHSALQTGSSSEQLNVIDAPGSAALTSASQPTPPSYQGSGVLLTVTPTPAYDPTYYPYQYAWYLNGNLIAGATDSTYFAEVSATNDAGTYSAVVSDLAGSVTPPTTFTPASIAPLSMVPNQMIFEPFNYPGANNSPGFDPARGGVSSTLWTALGVTNNYNQQTGVPVGWLETGTKIDYRTRTPDEYVDPASTIPAFSGPARSLTSPLDEYPVPGLASGFTWQGTNSPVIGSASGFGDWGWGYNPGGGDTNIYVNYGLPGADPVAYTTTDVNGNQVNLPLGATITSGTVYCSMVIGNSSLNTNGGFSDYYCGFGNGSTTGTTIWGGLFLTNLVGGAPVPYQIGIFKGSVSPGSSLNPGVNGDWDPNVLSAGQIYFLVLRLNINPAGGSTCDLWIDPPASSYYAGEANVPTPDVQGTAGSAPDVSGGISYFYMKDTTYPVSRDITDLRIGTTWASVTPPSAPTLTVNSATLTPCPPTAPVVFTVQNAGNQVTGNYAWTFNNGAGPVALSAGSNPNPVDPTDGAVFTVSGPSNQVLTVTGATGAEIGTYTVSGSNISPAPSDNGGPNEYYGLGTGAVTLTGSASGTLSFAQIPLAIGYVPGVTPSLVLSWTTNSPSCYKLQQTTSLSPAPIVWSPVSTPVVVVGANNTVTITPVPAVPTYYELIAAP